MSDTPKVHIVKVPVLGNYVHIEYDNSVRPDDRIFVLHSQAPGHPSFAMGAMLARAVAKELYLHAGGSIGTNTTGKDDAARFVLELRAAASIAPDGAAVMRETADFLDQLFK